MLEFWYQGGKNNTGTVFLKEQPDKNEAPSLLSEGPSRQEQEGSAEEPARASLVVLSIKGCPHQISGLERQEQEAPWLKVYPFLLCGITVDRLDASDYTDKVWMALPPLLQSKADCDATSVQATGIGQYFRNPPILGIERVDPVAPHIFCIRRRLFCSWPGCSRGLRNQRS